MRIVSLLPSATEIAFELGLGDEIVGVTHECDYPPQALLKPQLTRTTLDRSASSAEIDAATNGHLDAGTTSYILDEALLSDLEPDLILTQMLCEVCAVPHSLVRGALPLLSRKPKVLSLEPQCLADILSNIKTVGDHTSRTAEARDLIARLRDRLDCAAIGTAGRLQTRVLCLEWLDPPWSAGHWVPDMVGIAGGLEVVGRARQPSRRVTWDQIVRAQPDVIVLAVCGFDLPRTLQEQYGRSWPSEWWRLPAVVEGRVFAVDGSAYFTRPGPRLVDGVELLTALLDDPSGNAGDGWARVASR